MRLEWQPADQAAALTGPGEQWVRPGLVADTGGPCLVTFTVLPNGDYTLSWAVSIDHTKRTLAEAQRFAARIAELVNTLPVADP